MREEFEDATWQEQALIRFIGQRYAYELATADSPTLSSEYLHTLLDTDCSKVREYIKKLNDDSVIEQDKETGEWKLSPESLPKALSRIEGIDVRES